MNESFEVILNNEEFQNYKQLQKNADVTDKALREMRRDIENYKLKCDQQQLALSKYELKIKELSKNSIRLSRRLVAEQEEHFATQENFLAREKQLLEKLLTLSNDHENGAVILLTVREAKNKLETENGALKRKILEQENEIESLSSESIQLKKQLVTLSDRCIFAEGQQLIALKERDDLKVKMDHLCFELQSSLVKMEEKSQVDETIHNQEVKKITQYFLKKLNLAESNCQQLLNDKTHEIEQLSQKILENLQECNILKKRTEALEVQHNILHNKQQKTRVLLQQLKLNIHDIQVQDINQNRDINQSIRQFRQLLINNGEALQNLLLKHEAAQAQRIQQQGSIKTQQNLLERIWKYLHRQLEAIRKQLKKDQIVEEQIILNLQFNRVINQLKIQMDKQLSNQFHSWIEQ